MDVVLGRERTQRSKVIKQADVVALLAPAPRRFRSSNHREQLHATTSNAAVTAVRSVTGMHGVGRGASGTTEAALIISDQDRCHRSPSQCRISAAAFASPSGALWQIGTRLRRQPRRHGDSLRLEAGASGAVAVSMAIPNSLGGRRLHSTSRPIPPSPRTAGSVWRWKCNRRPRQRILNAMERHGAGSAGFSRRLSSVTPRPAKPRTAICHRAPCAAMRTPPALARRWERDRSRRSPGKIEADAISPRRAATTRACRGSASCRARNAARSSGSFHGVGGRNRPAAAPAGPPRPPV